MSIVDKKKKIFGNIAALRTLNDGLPKLKTNSSFPSINNKGNSITFLTDLLKALVGFEVLVTVIVDVLTYNLKQVELEIKKALKSELKSIVSCGVDPSIPAFLKSTGSGINIEVNKVDFTDQLLTDPNSPIGNLLYDDITPILTNSTDLNTFLYGALQNDGNNQSWGSNSPIGQNVLNVKFNSLGVGSIPNNTFTFNADPAYDSAPKTLTDLNNNFIDSLTLFNTENIVSRVMDTIFGSISFKKTKRQLESEAKVNVVIDTVINADKDDVIDDNFFVFTNQEIAKIQEDVDFRKKGIKKLECCNKVAASVPIQFLTNFKNDFSGATSTQQQKVVVGDHLNKMANQNTLNSPNTTDHVSIKLNFIQEIINNLTKVVINIILSPKVVLIFLINFKIIYGQNATFGDGVDFLRKNRTLLNNIMKRISYMLIKVLLALVLKQVAIMVAEAASKKQIEKGKANLAQLLSLVGISQDTLRLIQGLA